MELQGLGKPVDFTKRHMLKLPVVYWPAENSLDTNNKEIFD